MKVNIDGHDSSFVADGDRSDVADQHPEVGSHHGFDVTLPATGDAHKICITAINVGSGSDKKIGCLDMDWVQRFDGHEMNYDTEHAIIGGTKDLSLWRYKHKNKSSQPVKFTIKNHKDVKETVSWKNTQSVGAKVTTEMDGNVGIPVVASTGTKLTVEIDGSLQYEQSGSTEVSTGWEWDEELQVPPHRKLVTYIAVSENTLKVPYTMEGDFVYHSGLLVAGQQYGVYKGASSHDLELDNEEFYLNGKPVPDGTSAQSVKASRPTLTNS